MAGVMPSQLQTSSTAPWPVLIYRPSEGRRLSWPEWLVTYQDGVPARSHPSSTNRARRSATSLMRPMALLTSQTATHVDSHNNMYNTNFKTECVLQITL